MAPVLCIRGLPLLGLVLAARGEDDGLALVQQGVRVQGLPKAADFLREARVDLPDWMTGMINSGSDEDGPDGGDAAEAHELSEEEKKALDEEAEHGDDLVINYTAMEERAAMESIAEESAPLLKWFYLDTDVYDHDREFTNSRLWGDWRYDGNPGKFSVNINPQGELVYRTDFVPEHQAAGILLPIEVGPWRLQATVRDPNQNPLSLVRMKAMTNNTNVVVSFADANGTKWSRDVLAVRSTPLDKIIPKKLDIIPMVPMEKPEQEQDKLPLDLDSIDKACIGLAMITPECIKKHGVPTRGGLLGNQGHGKVKKTPRSIAETFRMAKRMMDVGGLDASSLDKVQAVTEALLGKASGQESVLESLVKSVETAEPEQAVALISAVLEGILQPLGVHLNVTQVIDEYLGGKSGLADLIGTMKGLAGNAGNLIKVVQGFAGSKSGANIMGALQGLLGGKSDGGADLAGLLPVVQGLLSGGKSGGAPNLEGLMPLVKGLLAGGKSGSGANLEGLLPLVQGLLSGGGKAGAGLDLPAIMKGLLAGGKAGEGDMGAALQRLLGGLAPTNGNMGNVVQHVMNLLNQSDAGAVPGEKPVEAFHRKFKAMRRELGLSRQTANATSQGEGVLKSIKQAISGHAAKGNSSSMKRGIFAATIGTEEQKQKRVYQGCQKHPAHQIANYSRANQTALGMQMWWPFELDEKSLDYGWLVDDWKSTAGVDVGSPFPNDGLVTGWQWYGSGTHTSLAGVRTSNETVHFQVLRWIGGPTGTVFQLVGQSTANQTHLRAFNNLVLDPKDYISVKKGDFVAFFSPRLTSFGYSMARVCELQVKLAAPSTGVTEIGLTADYMLGGEKNSPRAYHYHAQYVPNPAPSAMTELDRA